MGCWKVQLRVAGKLVSTVALAGESLKLDWAAAGGRGWGCCHAWSIYTQPFSLPAQLPEIPMTAKTVTTQSPFMPRSITVSPAASAHSNLVS